MTEIGKTLILGGLVALAMSGGFGPLEGPGRFGAAYAQDDDDGDDDDDDDNPRRDTTPRPTTPRPPVPGAKPVVPPARPQQPASVPLPAQAPAELVALGLSDADLVVLILQGFDLIEGSIVSGLDLSLHRLAVPDGLTLTQGRDLVRSLPSGQNTDFNHFYRAEQEPVAVVGMGAAPCDGLYCPAFAQVNWPVPTSRISVCGEPVVVGMIDTALNRDHGTFAGADLSILPLQAAPFGPVEVSLVQAPQSEPAPARDPSTKLHGTAVAALLIGDPNSSSPGLVPFVRLLAVDAFHRDGNDERADVVALALALGQLAQAGAKVINLSLAGPPNSVLEEIVTRLVQDRAITLVAAAGNDGPAAPPAYPAAYPGVIAVTAVDLDNVIYRRAGQGPHLGLAAPGVGVWTAASVSGVRDKSGTSFAAPFVTAAAVLLLGSDAGLTPAQIADRLFFGATDLGAPGRDDGNRPV